jgi:hypothetical protein
MKRFVEEVFVTEGVPQFTFVAPPNFIEILLDIRRPGKPVVIEGQSGTGKTTCIKKILERIGEGPNVTYWTARDAAHVSAIAHLAGTPTAGTFVIDDFHRLAHDTQMALGDIAKNAAEQVSANPNLPKLVLIGINQIGSELIQLVPDIAKRTGIHRIQPGTVAQIQELINAGCKELNITFENTDVIFDESRGDYWLTQQLCQSSCALNDVTETCEVARVIGIDLSVLRQRVVDRLKAAYYPAVKEFCRGQRFRPSNDPYYKLLRTVSEQDSSIVDLNELANAKAEVRGSINNIKERRLSILIQSKPACARHFYYNSETKNFAIEDPALFYFLKHLDWNALRSDCGFREAQKDYEFDFALSFAGENREMARHIAESLEILDANVFFDEQYEANYLGKAWSKEFLRIFGSASRLVVCLLDKNHKDKIWPTFERECFEPRVADAEVIPIFLDDTAFPGIPKDTIGIRYAWKPDDPRWRDDVIDNIVYKLLERDS